MQSALLARLDLLVPQALQVLKEKEVLPVPQELPELLDLPVLRGQMELTVSMV